MWVPLFTAAAGWLEREKDLNLSSGSYDTNAKEKKKAERSGTEPGLVRHRKESIHQEQPCVGPVATNKRKRREGLLGVAVRALCTLKSGRSEGSRM